MKRTFLIPALVLALAPQSAPAEDAGSEMMKRGIELFLEGLQDELDPALKDFAAMAAELGPKLSAFWDEMGPGLVEMLNQVRDWSAYEPPVMLPNGDIILRRKAPLVPKPEAPETGPQDNGPQDNGSDSDEGAVDL